MTAQKLFYSDYNVMTHSIHTTHNNALLIADQHTHTGCYNVMTRSIHMTHTHTAV